MKKITKWILLIVIVLVIVMILLIAGFFYITEYRVADIDSSVYEKGKYEVLFQTVGEPEFPFGNSHARLVLKRNGKVVAKHRLDVANDGKNLCKDNWHISWGEDSVEAVISGEEQQDEVIVLYFADCEKN